MRVLTYLSNLVHSVTYLVAYQVTYLNQPYPGACADPPRDGDGGEDGGHAARLRNLLGQRLPRHAGYLVITP